MIVTNDLPNITGEQTTAFANRIIGPIHLHKSFLGNEDHGLDRNCGPSYPGS